MKKCYYDILEVDAKATNGEIKTVTMVSCRVTGN